MRTTLVLALVTMLASCSSPPPSAVVSTGCAWSRPIYPPDAERSILVRQAPVTARAVAEHNAAVEAACPAAPRP